MLATLLYRFAQKIGADLSDTGQISYLNAPDADAVSNFAAKAMEWAYDQNLITGYEPSGNLIPKGNTKRGEYAKILNAAIDAFNQ